MRALRFSSLLASLCLLSLSAQADESAYWRARVSASVHLQAAPNPWYPPVPKSQPKVTAKPQVLVFFAPFPCPPCDVQRAEIKEWNDAPFKIVTTAKAPVQITFYPFTVWKNADGKWIYLESWKGRKDLIERWKRSQTNSAAQQPRHWLPMTGYQPGWTWPGDLRRHLQQTHGISEAGQLTQDQAEALHDKLHEGYSLQQIKGDATSNVTQPKSRGPP